MSSRAVNAVVAVVSAAAFLAVVTSMEVTEPTVVTADERVNNATLNATTYRGCDDVVANGSSRCVDLDWLKCVGVVGGCAAAGWVAFALMLPCLLLAVGFGVIGIAEGSLAAAFQSSYGTPCCFRCAQSTAMLGTPFCPRIFFGLFGAVLAGVLAYYYLPLPFCFPDSNQSPSCFCL